MPLLTRVGVLRGGPGSEYEVSLKTGAQVLKNLSADKYQPADLLLTRDGTWHYNGLPTSLSQIADKVDVIFNALHGEYGEDGQVQQLLDSYQLPYTGSGAVASALGMDKQRAKDIFKKAGLKTPAGLSLQFKNADETEDMAYDVFRQMAPPWIVKPAASGSSVGLSLVRTYPDLVQAIVDCFRQSPTIMVEEYIRGREATAGVVDGLRNQNFYPLLPVEIVLPQHKKLFDYEAKYSGTTQEICPGRFTKKEKEELEEAAVLIHRLLGLRHYSRSDFIISPRGIYILEVNTLPGLTEESLVPKSLKAAGISYGEFLDHLINLTLKS